jgi:hypothetical protein
LRGCVNDLARKAHWLPHYTLLPFIFGIAVPRDQLEIYTLHSDNTLIKAFEANLNDVVDRCWLCVVAAINIARTLKMFVEQRLVITSIRFDTWHTRNNKNIRLDVNFAEIEFRNRGDLTRMRKYYEATNAVPYLEHPYIDNS